MVAIFLAFQPCSGRENVHLCTLVSAVSFLPGRSRAVVAEHGDHRGDVQGSQEGGFGLFSGRSSLRKCSFRHENGARTLPVCLVPI